MKWTNKACAVVLFFAAFFGTAHCDAFRNLGFDEPEVSKLSVEGTRPDGIGGFYTYGFGKAADLLPGWTLRIDGSTVDRLNLNEATAGRDPHILWENRIAPFDTVTPFGYSLALSAQRPSRSMGISQMGEVPLGMNAIVVARTVGGHPQDYNPVVLSMTGEELKFIRVYDTNYFVYDVSKFVGKTVELDLTVRAYTGSSILSLDSTAIDSISFIIPEPSAGLLLFSGGLIMLAARRLLNRRTRS